MLRLAMELEALALVFKDDFIPPRKAIYLEVLADIPLDMALAACEAWLFGASPYFPTPGQLRILALNLAGDPRAPDGMKQRAELAWHQLRGSATTEPYNRWALQDPITQQVFRVMGGHYRTACGFGQWDTRYESMKHREFVQAYLDIAAQYAQALPPMLTEMQARSLEASVDRRDAPHDDSEQSTQDYRQQVKAIVAALQEKLAIPVPGVPAQYLREQRPGDPLAYTPSLSPAEFEARKALLHRQGTMLMALELAGKTGTRPAEED